MSYKFALINNGLVENIVESQDYEYAENLKPLYDTVLNVNNVYVEIGYLWNGTSFSPNPKVTERMDFSRQQQKDELDKFNRIAYENLLERYNTNPNSLSPDEKEYFEVLKTDLDN